MKKIIYIATMFLLACSGKSSAQEVLNQYLQTAAENNPGLKVEFNEYMAALEKIPQAGALPDPTVAFGYFISPVETRLGPQNAKISVSQMFPWFGSLSLKENAAESLAKAKYEMFEESKSELFYDVKSTYYNLYFTKKTISITKENIDILTSFRRLANVKIESGSASALDAYRIEMEINDLENQLAQLKDNFNELKLTFNKLLNVDLATDIEISELPVDFVLSKQTSLDSILINNNVLASYDYQLEGLRYEEQSSAKEGLPRFSLGLEYSFIGEGNAATPDAGQDAFVFPKVGISIPIYRSKYKAKVREVVYLREAKGFEKSDKENRLVILFENAWNDYSDAARRYELYKEQADLAQKSLSILESDYATSNTDFEELLRMERKLLKYAMELEKAIADKNAALAFIQYLQGK